MLALIAAFAITILAVIGAFMAGWFLGRHTRRREQPVRVVANQVAEEVEIHDRDEETGEEFTYEDPYVVASHFREYPPERNVDQDD